MTPHRPPLQSSPSHPAPPPGACLGLQSFRLPFTSPGSRRIGCESTACVGASSMFAVFHPWHNLENRNMLCGQLGQIESGPCIGVPRQARQNISERNRSAFAGKCHHGRAVGSAPISRPSGLNICIAMQARRLLTTKPNQLLQPSVRATNAVYMSAV